VTGSSGMGASAEAMIARLNLTRHPEGGWYRETWRAAAADGARAAGSAILFLLEAGEWSHWHRVDATELWLFHAGEPLVLQTAAGQKESWVPPRSGWALIRLPATGCSMSSSLGNGRRRVPVTAGRLLPAWWCLRSNSPGSSWQHRDGHRMASGHKAASRRKVERVNRHTATHCPFGLARPIGDESGFS
jgi:hypothetical protein